MRRRLAQLALLTTTAATLSAEPCRQIHGRATWYRGDGFFAIWHIGTHHVFMPDNQSIKLLCSYFDCEHGSEQPDLFADFTICPTEPYSRGAAQPVIVKEVRRPRVVPHHLD